MHVHKVLVWAAVALYAGAGATTFVREPNSRGPSAVQAGFECLMRVTRSYFNSTQVSRTRNMVIMHSSNLSAPAADIEIMFLARMHAFIASNNWLGLQLCIISNRFSTERLEKVDPNAVMLTDYYVLVVDNLHDLRHNMRRFIVVGRAYNPAARFVVMFSQPSLPLAEKVNVAHAVFKQMFRHFGASKVVVCMSAGHRKYDVYLTDPYRNATNCGSLIPHLVGQCNNGNFVNDEMTRRALMVPLVPAKMAGCSFKICARVTQPYIEEGCNQGLEIQLLKTLQTSMEFTADIKCELGERGDLELNGSWSQMLGELAARQCDLLVGGFFPDNVVDEYFAVTANYMQDTYTWYVYLARLQEPWRGLVAIFEPATWLLFLLILVCAAAAWLVFGRARVPGQPGEPAAHGQPVLAALNAWSVFLSVSANNRPERTPLRIFFVMLALYGLNVTTIYTSNLITMFTDPKHDAQPNSIEDILAAELPIGGREEYNDWFENDAPNDQVVHERYNFTEAFTPRIANLERVRDGHQAMLMNRFYVESSEIRDQMYAVPGNVFSSPLEMITMRGFPLLAAINRLINRMKDTGLMEKINSDFLYAMDLRESMSQHHRLEGTDVQKVLTVNHLQGAFAVLIIGLLASSLVFAAELVSVSVWWHRQRRAAGRRLQKVLVALRLAERQPKDGLQNVGKGSGGGKPMVPQKRR